MRLSRERLFPLGVVQTGFGRVLRTGCSGYLAALAIAFAPSRGPPTERFLMHDPMTVAFQVPYPWPWPRQNWGAEQKAPRSTLLTIWHVDPETDGSDDSCDWFWRKLTPAEERAALDLRDNEIDNIAPYLPADDRDSHLVMTAQWRAARRFYRPRPWWKHPRWHVHHWRFQLHPWEELRRWLFTRCATCGQRFPYGGSGISYHWDSPKHRWWQSEIGLHCFKCAGGPAESAAW